VLLYFVSGRRIYQLLNVIRTHHDIGMISLDESLVDLYNRRLITYQTVLAFCNDHDEVSKLITTGSKAKKGT